jgi:hypothetical protein
MRRVKGTVGENLLLYGSKWFVIMVTRVGTASKLREVHLLPRTRCANFRRQSPLLARNFTPQRHAPLLNWWALLCNPRCDENALPPLLTHFSPSMDHATSFKTKIIAGTNHPYNGTASKSISALEKQARMQGEDVRSNWETFQGRRGS